MQHWRERREKIGKKKQWKCVLSRSNPFQLSFAGILLMV